MMQSSESCLWKQFLRSEQEQEKETVKTKKAPPPSGRGLITDMPWGIGEKILLTLTWFRGRYEFTYNSYSIGYLYTPKQLQDVLTLCGMRQFYPPPTGGLVDPPGRRFELPGDQTEAQAGQSNNNVTCPRLPADPYDCTIPRLGRTTSLIKSNWNYTSL